MEIEWPTLRVSELQAQGRLLVEDGNHGEYRPLAEEFGSGATVFIRAADMDNGCVLFDVADRISDRALARIRKGIGKGGDALFSHKGTVGKLALVPFDAPPFVCSPQTTFWRVLDPGVLDRQFLYAFMRSDEFMEQWRARKGETDMADYVSLTAQRDFRVPIPPIREQEAIGRVLGGLDEKIDHNRRMNGTLAAIAYSLFKSRFVDFEPVSAKVAGPKGTDMDAETAPQCSEDVRDGEIRPTPIGWKNGTIANLARYINGRNFTQGATGTGRPVIRIAELKSGPGPSTVYNDVVAGSDHVAKPGDLLFAWSGSLGVYRWARDAGLINQHIFKVICDSLPQWFVHLHLLEAMAFFRGVAADKATTMGHIKREHLSQWQVTIPGDEVLRAAGRVVEPLYDRMLSNERESLRLGELRDALLPKLLSGELRVREAEKVVGQAGA